MKTKTCDSCGETWEVEFFCVKCSNVVYYEDEEVPNLMWCGEPGQEYVWESVPYDTGDICLNCCNHAISG